MLARCINSCSIDEQWLLESIKRLTLWYKIISSFWANKICLDCSNSRFKEKTCFLIWWKPTVSKNRENALTESVSYTNSIMQNQQNSPDIILLHNTHKCLTWTCINVIKYGLSWHPHSMKYSWKRHILKLRKGRNTFMSTTAYILSTFTTIPKSIYKYVWRNVR